MEKIVIKGARQHNLKNINLELPKGKLIVFTGLSGSGKSSLAFDTIYAEGQRRYVESLSSYARQFLGVMDKPDVDMIEGLSPAISIDQKSTSHNPRSTVGTVTEIYDYLRLFFARVGHPHCPKCGREISRQSADQIVQSMLESCKKTLNERTKKFVRFLILSPVVRDRKGEFSGLFENIRSKGYRTMRVDRKFMSVDEDIFLIKTNKHSIDVVVDRFSVERSMLKMEFVSSLRSRLAEAVEQSLALSDGLVVVSEIHDAGFSIPEHPKKITDHMYSEKFSCPVDNISLPEIEPRSFSFNSPHGACPTCSGIGSILTVDPDLVINPELSITEGGILPFARMFTHDTWYSRVIVTVCKKYGIDQRAALKHVSVKQRHILLFGTGDEVHHVTGTNRFGEMTGIEETFSGFIPELVRRYRESESDFLRAEIEKYMRNEVCKTCNGARLKKESLTITMNGRSIAEITDLSITDALGWIITLKKVGTSPLSQTEMTIGTPILKEIETRLGFLVSVGLEYLTLGRSANSLAGGEAQRIRLASQIGSGLTGVLYVLDEPSIGLHPRDNNRLIATLKRLRDLGNTAVVVEHDKEMIESADYVVDFGPGAGKFGGQVIAQGTVGEIKRASKSITGQFLSGKRTIRVQRSQAMPQVHQLSLTIHGVSHNNLKNIHVSFPLGQFICITGVSGSGKSSLIVETLYPALVKEFNPFAKDRPGAFKTLQGTEYIDKIILIDQSPIGRTPRSNPATYTGLFSFIRDVFSSLSESKLRGYKAGRFSFNVKGGRCEACEGEGQRRIEMQFLADVYVTCEVCGGKRYNSETLEVTYRGKNISQVLEMTVEEALEFFHNQPHILSKLQTLKDVGLSYIHLGQPATTLSGGEAQRVKLASELSRRATGRTVYILDEPTTGLHFADLEKLLGVLHRLVSLGNTVIVIEHNLDVIKSADWIIDLGPEGGQSGGSVVAQGTPKAVTKVKESYTGQFLKNILQ
ncbi:excinuclease ABC subunit UvrA [Candidatus Gottesmanbacteria bacterium]|nr:excinuclease ABC subunit UvrA [Candidatus Gottesmanbacteria bacterium]